MTKHMMGSEALVAASESLDPLSCPGVRTATLAGFARTGAPLVDISSAPPRAHVVARSCVPLNASNVGQQVVIISDANDPDSPIVIGVIRESLGRAAVEITVDGQNIAVRAQESIVLKCGDASITLDRDGKVMIRGKHIVTQASGVNRIRGGSVELN